MGYLQGRRKYIYNPAAFLIISATLYLLAESLLGFKREKLSIDSTAYSLGYEAGQFVREYFKYFWVLSVVWLTTSTKLVFGRYHFAEHLAINAFVIGQGTLMALIGYLVFRVPLLFNPVFYLILVWLLYAIFGQDQRKIPTLLKSVGTALLFFLQLAIMVVLISWGLRW